MFLDYLYNLPNSTEGLDEILIETASAVPMLTPFLMFFVYSVTMLIGISLQKNRSGFADYPMWSVVGGMATIMVSLILSVQSGFILLSWLVLAFVITIASAMWLFLDRKQSEI